MDKIIDKDLTALIHRNKNKLEIINKFPKLKGLFSSTNMDYSIPRTKSKFEQKKLMLGNFEHSLDFQIFKHFDEVMPILTYGDKKVFMAKIVHKQTLILENICKDLFDFSDIESNNFLMSRILFLSDVFKESTYQSLKAFKLFGVVYEYDYNNFIANVKETNKYIEFEKRYLDLREQIGK